MMKKLILSIATLCVLTTVFAVTLVQGWAIKSDYSIKFTSEDASGIFKTFSGNITFDGSAASSFQVSIDVNSINTGNGMQNKHAKGDEWFDAAKYPNITFTSSKVAKTGNTYAVTGILDMHGVKKEITIPFTFTPKGNDGLFFATFSVNRNDYKIGKPASGDAGVVKLEVSVPVTKK